MLSSNKFAFKHTNAYQKLFRVLSPNIGSYSHSYEAIEAQAIN